MTSRANPPHQTLDFNRMEQAMKNIQFAYAGLLLLLSLLWWMADPLLPKGYEYFALRTVTINSPSRVRARRPEPKRADQNRLSILATGFGRSPR